MKDLVETLESTSNPRAHSTCSKQRRLFRALYDVAAKYVEVKSRMSGGSGGMSWPMARPQSTGAFAGMTLNDRGLDVLNPGGVTGDRETMNTTDTPSHRPSHDEFNGDRIGHADGLVEPTVFGDVDMGMDLSGAQLWDWFNKNQAMMRLLEDT